MFVADCESLIWCILQVPRRVLCCECLAPGTQSASQLDTCCAFGVIVQNPQPAPLFRLFLRLHRLSLRSVMHPLRCV